MSSKKVGRENVLKWGIVTLVVALVAVIGYDIGKTFIGSGDMNTVTYGVWVAHSRFSQLKQGMTKDEVKSLVGSPDNAHENPSYQRWDYEMPTSKSGPQNPTEMAFVDFDPNGRVTSAIPTNPGVWPRGIPTPGMTTEQVRKLAGPPQSVYHHDWFELWDYHLWGGIHWVVTFDRQGRVLRP